LVGGKFFPTLTLQVFPTSRSWHDSGSDIVSINRKYQNIPIVSSCFNPWVYSMAPKHAGIAAWRSCVWSMWHAIALLGPRIRDVGPIGLNVRSQPRGCHGHSNSHAILTLADGRTDDGSGALLTPGNPSATRSHSRTQTLEDCWP